MRWAQLPEQPAADGQDQEDAAQQQARLSQPILHAQRFPTIRALLVAFACVCDLGALPALRTGLYGPPALRMPFLLLAAGTTAFIVVMTLRAIRDVRDSPWMRAQRLIDGD